MSSRGAIRIEGLGELERKLRRLPNAVAKRRLRKAVENGADIVVDVAQQLAPRRTGTLADNIHHEVTIEAATRAEFAVGPDRRKGFYGIFQELGTSDSPAQPFLRPAMDETRQSVVDEVRDTLRESLEGVVRGVG